MDAGTSLSQGNRLQRAYHRWALPYYERMEPELRAQSEAVDRFLYSRRGLVAWLGLLAAIAGGTLGMQRAGLPLWLALVVSLLVGAGVPLMLLSAWLQPTRFTAPDLRRKLPWVLLMALAGALSGFLTGHVARHGRLDPALVLARLLDGLGLLLPAVLLAVAAIVGLLWGTAQVRRQVLEHTLRQTRLQQELDAAAREAAEARLKLLQGQIQPHFIFNTLSAVQHWVDAGDPRGAPLLRALTAFLRGSTEALSRETVTLADEAALAGHYLAIMQARLGERLRWTMTIAPGLRTQPLPPGLLLTLVENAVEHGLAPALAGGVIDIRACPLDPDRQTAELVVRDSGGRLGAPIQEGVGLSNTRERLQRRFGRAATLTLGTAADGHTEAVLRWPLTRDTTTPDAVRPGGAA